jgi:hypothetical protein
MTAERPSGASSLGSPGARWTPEEEEALVAAVRAGAALQAIAERHGRGRGGIESRLRKMIPADADVPKEEQLGWIVGKLADPAFDWRTPLAQSRPARRPSSEARPRSPAPAASSPAEVLGIWQAINHRELAGQRRADFLVHPAIDDLVYFPAEIQRERGYHSYERHGHLLLNDWAAECAMPGWTDLPSAGDLLAPLATAGDTVRKLVAATVAAIPDEGDRSILERRLGLPAGTPQTLEAIAADLGLSRERIRQRQDRALRTAASGAGTARTRAGYGVLRERARSRLSEFIGGGAEQNFLPALAALSFPGVQPGYAARVITVIAGRSASG